MCRQCEDCAHAKFSKGAQRGVMDCDPDEYWCSADNEFYYYNDDKDIIAELKADYMAMLKQHGLSDAEALKEMEDMEFEADCPDYCYSDHDYYDEPFDNADYYYDMMKDEGLL